MRIFCELINHTTKQKLPLSNSVEVPRHRCQTQAGKLLPGTVINSLIHTARLFCSVANRWYIESETRSKSRLPYVRSCPFADGLDGLLKSLLLCRCVMVSMTFALRTVLARTCGGCSSALRCHGCCACCCEEKSV